MFNLVFKKNNDVTPLFKSYVNKRQYSSDPSGTVFSVMNLKAKFFSQLVDESKIDGEVKETFFDTLLANPNPTLNWEQIKFLAQWWVLQTGNAYIYAPLNKQGVPFGLYVLPSTLVTVKATSEVVDYYEYRVGNDVVIIYPNEIIHYRRMFPSSSFEFSHLLGQPKELQQSLDYMELEVSAVDFVQSFFDADGVTPYVLSAEDNLTPEVLKKHKAGFNESIGNNKYQVQAIIGAGARVEPLAKSSQADGLAVKESEEIVNRICRIWDVPSVMLDQDYAGKAIADNVIKNFYDRSMSPDVRNFEQTITAWGRKFQDGFEYNIKDYEVQDTEENRKQETHDFGLGLKTRNDLRAERGLEPVANGDVYMIAGNYYPLDDLLYTPAPSEKKKELTEL